MSRNKKRIVASFGILALLHRLDRVAEAHEKAGDIKGSQGADAIRYRLFKAMEEEGLFNEIETGDMQSLVQQALALSQEQVALLQEALEGEEGMLPIEDEFGAELEEELPGFLEGSASKGSASSASKGSNPFEGSASKASASKASASGSASKGSASGSASKASASKGSKASASKGSGKKASQTVVAKASASKASKASKASGSACSGKKMWGSITREDYQRLVASLRQRRASENPSKGYVVRRVK